MPQVQKRRAPVSNIVMGSFSGIGQSEIFLFFLVKFTRFFLGRKREIMDRVHLFDFIQTKTRITNIVFPDIMGTKTLDSVPVSDIRPCCIFGKSVVFT
jgi:hypothetical protein